MYVRDSSTSIPGAADGVAYASVFHFHQQLALSHFVQNHISENKRGALRVDHVGPGRYVT